MLPCPHLLCMVELVITGFYIPSELFQLHSLHFMAYFERELSSSGGVEFKEPLMCPLSTRGKIWGEISVFLQGGLVYFSKGKKFKNMDKGENS